jgi:hypothetical protein
MSTHVNNANKSRRSRRDAGGHRRHVDPRQQRQQVEPLRRLHDARDLFDDGGIGQITSLRDLRQRQMLEHEKAQDVRVVGGKAHARRFAIDDRRANLRMISLEAFAHVVKQRAQHNQMRARRPLERRRQIWRHVMAAHQREREVRATAEVRIDGERVVSIMTDPALQTRHIGQ